MTQFSEVAILSAPHPRDAGGAQAAMRTLLMRQREALRWLDKHSSRRIAKVPNEHDTEKVSP